MFNPLSKIKQLLKDPKGFTQVLVAIVIVAVAVIMIMVTTVVLSLFTSQIQTNISGLSAAANTTIASVSAAGFGSLNLLTVVLYVLAAVAIIGAVMGIFAYIRMKQQ